MGVDYYHCECCGESKYSEYVGSCNKCGSSLCTDCLINKDKQSRYAGHYGYRFDSTNPELMKKYEEEGYELYDSNKEPLYDDNDIIDDSGIDSKYCPYCSGDNVSESALFSFIMDKYKLNYEEERKDYKLKNK